MFNSKPKGPREENMSTPTPGDAAEKPFPCKPVYLKRIEFKYTSRVHSTFTSKRQDAANNSTLAKDLSRQSTAELQMTKAIKEQQLTLQMKLWKLEETVRNKTHKAGDGVTAPHARKPDTQQPLTRSKQRTDERSREMHSLQHYKPRRDTTTHKSEPMSAGETPKRETSRAKRVSSEQTHSRGRGTRDSPAHEELVLPQASSPPPRTPDADQLLPCLVCERRFLPERLEKHRQICKRVTKRPVFNSQLHRVKGSALEDFLRTHERSRTPEVFWRRKQRKTPKK